MSDAPASPRRRMRAPVGDSVDAGPPTAAFVLYCLFIVSYFLHLGARISALGSMRIDILLCGLALAMSFSSGSPGAKKAEEPLRQTSKLLLILVVYIVVSLPFVRWPGSVLHKGWDPFLKAILFYVLTVRLVTTEHRLKVFLIVFLGAQTFRVLEPLYMHLTTGYWGSFTNMGNYEFMNRLSGAPFDIVNPNGLAFVILVVITLSHHILAKGSRKQQLLYLAMLAPLLYALSLTGSRSGMSGMVVFALLVVWNSKRRAAALATLAAIVLMLLAGMSDLERQRYLSIVDSHAKGSESAQGRWAGMWTDVLVGMQRPIFGHGLGTSLEANANVTGEALPSHTLYAEIFQELGLIGLAIFVAFIIETCRNCFRAVRDTAGNESGFLHHAAESCRDFTIVLVVFSIASYGLNEYEWYLTAGLAVVLSELGRKQFSSSGKSAAPSAPPKPVRDGRRARTGVPSVRAT